MPSLKIAFRSRDTAVRGEGAVEMEKVVSDEQLEEAIRLVVARDVDANAQEFARGQVLLYIDSYFGRAVGFRWLRVRLGQGRTHSIANTVIARLAPALRGDGNLQAMSASQFRGWLASMARDAVDRRLAKMNKERATPLGSGGVLDRADPSCRTPAEELEEAELGTRVWNALGSLEREVVKMRYFEEKPKPFGEIGQSLGITEVNARQVHRRALFALRQALRDVLP